MQLISHIQTLKKTKPETFPGNHNLTLLNIENCKQVCLFLLALVSVVYESIIIQTLDKHFSVVPAQNDQRHET